MKTITLRIADASSPTPGDVMYRFSDDDALLVGPETRAPNGQQAALKALFDTAEGLALDDGKTKAETQAADLETKRAALDARLAGQP